MIRGWLYRKIKGKLKREKRVEETYVKAETPEEMKKYIRKGEWIELAEAKKENMKLREELKKRDEFIKLLERRMGEELKTELSAQQKILNRLKKSRTFTSLLIPEKPIVWVSSYNYQPFNDEYGEPRPYFVGFELRSAPPPLKAVFVPLMAKDPKVGKMFWKEPDIACLETEPPITLDAIHQLFPNLELFVHTMKTGGVVPVNITPDGYFTGTTLPFKIKKLQPLVPTEPKAKMTWSEFFKMKRKEGLSAKEIGELWKKYKGV